MCAKPAASQTSSGAAADISVSFDMPGIDLVGKVRVFDIWAQNFVGEFSGSYTAKQVPFHGTAFLRLSLA